MSTRQTPRRLFVAASPPGDVAEAYVASLDGLDPPALEGRKWVYRLDAETGKPTLDLDPPLDTPSDDVVPLFRVR